MPIYEYSCTNCGYYLTKLQKFTDEPITVCPKCSESQLRKLVSAAGFQLKGTGWYVTDFRNSKQGGSAGEKAVKEGDKDKMKSTEHGITGEAKEGTDKNSSTGDNSEESRKQGEPL